MLADRPESIYYSIYMALPVEAIREPQEWEYGMTALDDFRVTTFRYNQQRLQVLEFLELDGNGVSGYEVEVELFLDDERVVAFLSKHEGCSVVAVTRVEGVEDTEGEDDPYAETKLRLQGYSDVDYSELPNYLEHRMTLFPAG